jgi:3-oxoacyl-[acyl-carrier protein] reductase
MGGNSMLQGKSSLVTGGGTGMGRSIALALARGGANVAINYSRSQQDALKTGSEIESLGVKCLVCKANVAEDSEVRSMVDKVVGEFGRLDVLVNSAGITYFIDHKDLNGLEDRHWDEIMSVNVKGMFHCCRAATEYLKSTNGCIVNMSSIAGLTGRGSSIPYAASKAAVISITKSLARVLAPEVRVNCIAPGVVKTRWIEGQDVSNIAGATLLGRIAEPDDIAEVAISLITSARYVTGQTIVVDGGSNI